jgi:hypothetical protein
MSSDISPTPRELSPTDLVQAIEAQAALTRATIWKACLTAAIVLWLLSTFTPLLLAFYPFLAAVLAMSFLAAVIGFLIADMLNKRRSKAILRAAFRQ